MTALAYIALGLAVVAVLCAIVARRRRAAAERAWRETCARYPWRVAAVFDGGPLLLLLDDDLLRAWWHDAGEPRPWETGR